MVNDIYFEGDAEVLPFTTEIKPPTVEKPSDKLDFVDVKPNTIWYLSIIKPHTDSHEIIGPAKAFHHLLYKIEDVVSNSPKAIDKLELLKEKEDFLTGEKEIDEEFLEKGFEVFIVEGQRGSYTILKIHREINKEVFDILPAPVYTVISAGPLKHATIPAKSSSSSSSTSLSSKFTPGKPKGYASTTYLHGSYIDRAAAKEDAEHFMTVLLLDAENVKEIARWEKGSKGGGILIGMNATTMWEVKVVYMDDPIGRAQEDADRVHDAFIL
jgi:hypothetical protein